MRDIVRLALRLFIFAFVVAAKQEALSAVFPGCEYEPTDFGDYDTSDSDLDELFVAKDAAGETVGYALTASPQGYGGEIPITLGVSVDGYVTYIYIGALQETAGLGTRGAEPDFMNQFVGIAADPNTLDSDVSTISGATISSSAVVGAVRQMLEYTSLSIEPHAGDKEALLAQASGDEEANEETGEAAAEGSAKTYDVTGFGPMKVAVEVDADGKIVSVSVPEHNETPGYGADLIADSAVFDALVGQDIAAAQIDVKSGATLTSNAINDALAQAAADYAGGGNSAEAPAIAGDPYTVKGMYKFTLYVEVEDGKIVSVSAPGNIETPGFGADMLTDEALSVLVGQDIATAHIDVKSGVTMTSDAINEALRQAAAANGFEPAQEEESVPASAPAPEAQEDASSEEGVTTGVYDVKGFADFKVEVAVDADGKIVSVSVPEHSETPGFGADVIADTAVFDALVGQDIATAQIDVKAGATLTCDAINDALAQAAEAFSNGAAPDEEAFVAAGDPYSVKGMYEFTMYIDVEDGKIVSICAPDNIETPGFGADMLTDEALSALIGQDIATAQIDVKAGATITSNAINDALTQAAEAYAGSDSSDASSAEGVTTGVYDVKGFADFKVEVAVDADGKIVSVSVPEHSETPGFGADVIADTAVFDALVGQDIATAQIDVKAGATLTCDAINDALAQAAKEVQ